MLWLRPQFVNEAMELGAAAGVQHAGSRYQGFWSARGGRSGGSSSVARRLGNLSLWGNPRFLGKRGARSGAVVLKCSSDGGREADGGRWVLYSMAIASEDLCSSRDFCHFLLCYCCVRPIHPREP